MNSSSNTPYANQQGTTLAISLIVLLLMTLIGLAAIKSSFFQEKMSANMLDKEYSFEASEAALYEAKTWLMSLKSYPLPMSSCTTKPCVLEQNSSRSPELQNTRWWDSFGFQPSVSLPTISKSPQYVIEYQRFVSDNVTIGHGYSSQGTHFYQVTTRGYGKTTTSKTQLKASVARRF